MVSRTTPLNIKAMTRWIRFPGSRQIRAASIAVATTLFLWVQSGSPAVGLPRDQGSPVAVVDQASHDFGEVYEGERISHTFRIRNTGTAPLEIREPDPKAENDSPSTSARNAPVVAALRPEGNTVTGGLLEGLADASVSTGFKVAASLAGTLPAAGRRPAAPS
jgi:hypothetical protein